MLCVLLMLPDSLCVCECMSLSWTCVKVESPLYAHVFVRVCVWCLGEPPVRECTDSNVCVTVGCSWLLSWIEADMAEAGLTDWQAAPLLLGILTWHTNTQTRTLIGHLICAKTEQHTKKETNKKNLVVTQTAGAAGAIPPHNSYLSLSKLFECTQKGAKTIFKHACTHFRWSTESDSMKIHIHKGA